MEARNTMRRNWPSPGLPHSAAFRHPFMFAAVLCLAMAAPAMAGPVLCTTTLEAPRPGGTGPIEVTRCGVVRTAPELMRERFYSYTAPYARGVSVVNQITDFFGIAMGGTSGTRIMGLGFPDQTIIWDGSAVEHTTRVLLTDQSDPMPWRTMDVPNGFGSSLGTEGAQPARGLW